MHKLAMIVRKLQTLNHFSMTDARRNISFGKLLAEVQLVNGYLTKGTYAIFRSIKHAPVKK